MLNEFLPDELDKDALRIVYDKWQGKAVDAPRFKIAAHNLIGYGIYLTPDSVFASKGDPAPTFAAVSEEETEKAFESLLQEDAGNSQNEPNKVGAGGAFLTIILPLLLKLLAGYIK